MQITLVSSYSICAAHRLKRDDWSSEQNERVFGKCATLHGHEYKLEVHLTGEMSPETGMLINGFDVDTLLTTHILSVLDHKCLNDDVPFFKTHQPTAEWIAVWVYDTLKPVLPAHVTLSKVRIYETPSLAAEYPSL